MANTDPRIFQQLNNLLANAWNMGINITEMEVSPDIYRELMMTNVITAGYVPTAGFTTNVYESNFGAIRILLGHGSSKKSPTLEPSKLKDWFDNHK